MHLEEAFIQNDLQKRNKLLQSQSQCQVYSQIK